MANEFLPEINPNEEYFCVDTYPGRRKYFLAQASEFILDRDELNQEYRNFMKYLGSFGRASVERAVPYPIKIDKSRDLEWSLDGRSNFHNT